MLSARLDWISMFFQCRMIGKFCVQLGQLCVQRRVLPLRKRWVSTILQGRELNKLSVQLSTLSQRRYVQINVNYSFSRLFFRVELRKFCFQLV